MSNKQKLHTAYLLLCAVVILHGTIMTMIVDGAFEPEYEHGKSLLHAV